MWRIRFRTLFLEPIRSRDMCLVGAFLLSSWTWCQRMRRRHPSNRKLQRSHIAPRFKRLIDQSEAQSRWYWWRQPIAKSWARDPSHRYISNYTKSCFFCRVQLQLTWLSGVFIVSLFRFEVFYKPRNGCSSHKNQLSKAMSKQSERLVLHGFKSWHFMLSISNCRWGDAGRKLSSCGAEMTISNTAID